MKSVNVCQLKSNPSDVLRMARKAPVVVMNRDRPEALLFHLDDEGLLGEPGVRLALATSLYKNDSVSLGRGRRSRRWRLRSSCSMFPARAFRSSKAMPRLCGRI